MTVKCLLCSRRHSHKTDCMVRSFEDRKWYRVRKIKTDWVYKVKLQIIKGFDKFKKEVMK